MLWSRIFFLTLVCIVLTGYEDATTFEDLSLTEYKKTVYFFEKTMRQVMRKHHLPALAMTVIEDQDVFFQDVLGLADIEHEIDASAKTAFKIYSVAKAFTALEIFREVEEGLIDLDQPISRYLPEFSIQNISADEKSITPKNLLAHRSGLPRNACISVSVSEGDSNSMDRFELSTADCYMTFPPETRYKYSNLGYNLLGRIIEHNRGESFSGFMKDHLLQDLGMDNSTFDADDLSDQVLLAKGYEYYKGDYYPMMQYDIRNVPSGNLYTTIEDLTVFLKSVFSNTIFNHKETMSLMFADHFSKPDDPETMGLGWKTSKVLGSELLIWHDGGPAEGIGALIAFLPEWKLGLALIGNGTSLEGSISVPLAIKILQKVLETKQDFELPKDEKPERIYLSSQYLDDFSGTYVVFGTVMDVKTKNNKLKAKIGGIRLNLIPYSANEFFVTHWIDKIGLTKIFKPPIDFDNIRIYFSCNTPDSCSMIINLDNIAYEICPKYPDPLDIPENWKLLEGDYQIAERLPGNETGNLTSSYFSIYREEQVLFLSGSFGPIVPLNDRFIKISGGAFAGEVMEYDPVTGNIIHQDAIFIPVNRN